MTYISRPAAGVAALTLSVLPFALPTGASADTGPASRTKAAIEHEERLEGSGPHKAQIEHAERQSAPVAGTTALAGTTAQGGNPVDSPAPSGGGNAAAWQLALSAALGATVTGGAVLAARLASHHRHAVPS